MFYQTNNDDSDTSTFLHSENSTIASSSLNSSGDQKTSVRSNSDKEISDDEYFGLRDIQSESEDDIINNIEYVMCHICGIDIPKCYLYEHTMSVKHKTHQKIFNIVLERTKYSSNIKDDINKLKSDPKFYFCPSCATVIKLKDKKPHDISLKHKYYTIFDAFLKVFIMLYHGNESFVLNIDNTENYDNVTMKTPENNHTHNKTFKSSDTVRLDSLDDMKSDNCEGTTICIAQKDYSNYYKQKLTEIMENVSDDILQSIINVHNVSKKITNERITDEVFYPTNDDDNKLTNQCGDGLHVIDITNKKCDDNNDFIVNDDNKKLERELMERDVNIPESQLHDNCVTLNTPIGDPHITQEGNLLLLGKSYTSDVQNKNNPLNTVVINTQCNISPSDDASPSLGSSASNKNELSRQIRGPSTETMNNNHNHATARLQVSQENYPAQFCKICQNDREIYSNNVLHKINEEICNLTIHYLLEKQDDEEIWCKICQAELDISSIEIQKHLRSKSHKQLYDKLLRDNNILDHKTGRLCCFLCQNSFLKMNEFVHICGETHKQLIETNKVENNCINTVVLYDELTIDQVGSYLCAACHIPVKNSDKFKLWHNYSNSHIKNMDMFASTFRRVQSSSETIENDVHYIVHYHMVIEDQLNEVHCVVCNEKVPRYERNVNEHINGNIHKFKYDKLIEDNSIQVLENNKKFCSICSLALFDKRELLHCKSKKHIKRLKMSYMLLQ